MAPLQISAAKLPDFYSEVPEEPFTLPLGKANVVYEGSDATVVTYGAACVAAAKNEADRLKIEGISLEVIDLRTVFPWDADAILSSVSKTGRCIFFHEDYYRGGMGEQILGELSDNPNFLSCIKTPSIPVVGASTPFSATDIDLTWDRMPYRRKKTDKGDLHYSDRLAEIPCEDQLPQVKYLLS